MLTLRPTKRLAKRVGLVLPPYAPPVPHAVGDWCVSEFDAVGCTWLIACNTASLFPFVLSANGVEDEPTLIARVAGGLSEVVTRTAKNAAFSRWVKTFPCSLQYAPIPDRAILSTVSELSGLASVALEDGVANPQELSRWLAAIPLTVLDGNSPDRAFGKLG